MADRYPLVYRDNLQVYATAVSTTGISLRIVGPTGVWARHGRGKPYRVEWMSKSGTGWSEASAHGTLSAASRAWGKALAASHTVDGV